MGRTSSSMHYHYGRMENARRSILVEVQWRMENARRSILVEVQGRMENARRSILVPSAEDYRLRYQLWCDRRWDNNQSRWSNYNAESRMQEGQFWSKYNEERKMQKINSGAECRSVRCKNGDLLDKQKLSTLVSWNEVPSTSTNIIPINSGAKEDWTRNSGVNDDD